MCLYKFYSYSLQNFQMLSALNLCLSIKVKAKGASNPQCTMHDECCPVRVHYHNSLKSINTSCNDDICNFRFVFYNCNFSETEIK